MQPTAVANHTTHGTRRQTVFHLSLLTLAALALSWPVLLHGIPDLSHDGIMHATWTKPFAEQFWGGELYPRWLKNTNGGLGSAPFFIYPTLPTTVSALIAPLVGNHDPHGWLLAGISCVIAMILSGYTAYFWLRDLTSPAAALFAATLYLLMPYHTAIDLYNRGAELELWSFVSVPLILWSVQSILRGKRWGFVGLAASYALLIESHLPITVAFSLVPLALAYFLSESGCWRTVLITGGVLACGAGLAAIYLIPAMLDQSTVHVEHHLDPSFSYFNWWLFQRAPLFDYKNRLLFLTTSTLLFATAMWWFSHRFIPEQHSRRRERFFYAGVALVAFLMMTQLTSPIWKYVRPLQYLPFPTRFNVVLAAATTALAAIAFPTLRQASRTIVVICGLIVLVWIGADFWAAATGFSAWRSVPAERLHANARAIELLRDYPLAWPATSHLRQHELPNFERFLAQHPPKELRIVDSGGESVGTASVVDWQAREIHLRIQARQDAILHINHFYYVGWQARVEGTGRELSVQHDADGLLEIAAPAGTYTITLLLAKRLPEKFGIAISLGSLLLLIVLASLSGAGRTPWFLKCRATPADFPIATRNT
ncbi:MAG: hypothetical protein WB762_00995, partial [Candidatus Sulfotelmatobacter sp.]